MAYVYRHIRLDKNEPFYIGIGSDVNGLYLRANDRYKRNDLWNKVTNKTEYRVEILIDDLTWEEACEKEKEFIALYGRKNLKSGILVNLTDGGDGTIGFIISDESRKKMSNSRSGSNNHFFGKKHTEEARKKISDAESGANNHFYGKHLSAEHKAKISKSNIGKNKSAEHIRKMSECRIGLIAGGKHHNAKLVLDLKTGIYYDCAKDAAFSLNMVHSTIRGFLNGTYSNKTSLVYV